MATVPTGYTAGSPVDGVIPLYDSTSGLIAGTMQNGVVKKLDTQANKNTAYQYQFPNEIGVSGGTGAGGAAGAAGASPQSYLNSSSGSGGSGNMTWNDIQSLGYTPKDLAAFQQRGWTPAQVMDSYQKGYSKPSVQAAAAAPPQQDAFGITHVDSGKGYSTLTNPKTGQTVNVDSSGNYFTTDASGNNTPVSDTAAQGMGFQSSNPEVNAQKQMAQIDPASEALRSAVASSYLPGLQQAAAGGPNATQLQSYLDTYKQLDPQAYAQRQAQQQQVADYVTSVTGQAPTSMQDALSKYQQLDPKGYASMTALNASEDASLKTATDQLALGSQLDPTTARQVEQQARMGQAARGNVYGTPQMVSEAMATGQAGEQRLQQRQAAAQAAQGNMQSYLTSGATLGALGNQMYQQGVSNRANALGLQQNYLASGQTLGDTALNLYNQNQANLRANQQGALSYLGSGQTPYQAGSGYVTGANANAATAAGGGPVYQPAALGAGQLGTAQQAPQYGLDLGAQSQSYFNSLNNFVGGAGGATKNRQAAALTGAASGALSGGISGAAMGGPYAPLTGAIGAVAGGAIGGASGYYS